MNNGGVNDMIDDKNKLVACMKLEEKLYREIGYKGKIHAIITQCEVGKIMNFMKVLRKDEFYTNTSCSSVIRKVIALYYRRKHNILGMKLGMSIPVNTFGKGLLIYHPQGIIVHKEARCGEFCKLHGCNCVGNSGKEKEFRNTPILGKNIDLGVGAKIIGGIEVADGVVVAANAVVCKSISSCNSVVAGIPAKILKQQ